MVTGRTDESRKDAARIALTSGLTRRQVADDLGVGLSTLKTGDSALRHGCGIARGARGCGGQCLLLPCGQFWQTNPWLGREKWRSREGSNPQHPD